jgi:hypothetical protein
LFDVPGKIKKRNGNNTYERMYVPMTVSNPISADINIGFTSKETKTRRHIAIY